jgi:hypothetical protein
MHLNSVQLDPERRRSVADRSKLKGTQGRLFCRMAAARFEHHIAMDVH